MGSFRGRFSWQWSSAHKASVSTRQSLFTDIQHSPLLCEVLVVMPILQMGLEMLGNLMQSHAKVKRQSQDSGPVYISSHTHPSLCTPEIKLDVILRNVYLHIKKKKTDFAPIVKSTAFPWPRQDLLPIFPSASCIPLSSYRTLWCHKISSLKHLALLYPLGTPEAG